MQRRIAAALRVAACGLAACCLLAAAARAADAAPAAKAKPAAEASAKPAQSEHVFEGKVTTVDRRTRRKVTRTFKMKYLLFVPKAAAADKKKRRPTILFLHGAGERGDNLRRVKVHGPPKTQ